MDETRVTIAGVTIQLLHDRPIAIAAGHRTYGAFFSSTPAEIELACRWSAEPCWSDEQATLLFDSGSLWRLAQQGDQLCFVLGPRDRLLAPDCVARLAPGLRSGSIEYNSTRVAATGAPADPLRYPLGEALMITLLGEDRGVMLHGCGVDDRGTGLVFLGQSGAGKTTMARLWGPSATILNDDRVVVRRQDGQFWLYGTPWHGELERVAAHRVPLRRVYFLEHGATNELLPRSPSWAATQLVARAFPPIWSPAAMKFTLDLLVELAQTVACHTCRFVPDPIAVKELRCAI